MTSTASHTAHETLFLTRSEGRIGYEVAGQQIGLVGGGRDVFEGGHLRAKEITHN